MKKSLPAISVIIPVYNAERYFGVCLESLLIQTLTDFEVIVVDDCSTDASPAVAESYLERFGGRLKIVTAEKNSGSGGYVPRNIGLNFASGKYVYFMDADDLLIDEALETFHEAAEDFQADVVYPEAFFTCDARPVPSQVYAAPWNPKLTVDEPTLESDDFAERVRKFTDIHVRWTPWGKFVRRGLLLANDIKFLPLRTFADGIWTLELLCFAKRWLRLPTPLYIYRINDASINNRPRAPQDALKFFTSPLIIGVEYLNEFVNKFEPLRKHPYAGVRVINSWANQCFQHMAPAFEKLSPREVFEFFLNEFEATGTSQPALLAYLLFIANTYRRELQATDDA